MGRGRRLRVIFARSTPAAGTVPRDSVPIGWSILDGLKPPPGGSTAWREGSPIKALLFAP